MKPSHIDQYVSLGYKGQGNHQGNSNYGNKFDVVTRNLLLNWLLFLDGHYMKYILVSC